LNPVFSALVWLVVTGLALAVSFLPRSLEMALGPWLGRLAYHLDPKRRVIAFENIRRCLPELGPRGWRKLLKENYEHYGILTLEMLHMFSPIPGHYRRYVEKNSVVDGLDVFERLSARGKGTIAVTGHFANWEMMGIAGLRGLNVVVTGKTVKPAWLNKKLVAARASINVRTASGKRILPEILRWIKSGNTGTFILDQYTAPPSGVPAKFFGVTVDTQGAVGLVSQRTEAPIFMVFTRRDKKGVIHAVFDEVVPTKEELEDPLKMTQLLAGKVEAWLRENPAQWLWVHRRFKNVVWPAERERSVLT
jgi:Kdo2-lipid IVA lauroyltransferase/acyltransferase